MKKELNSKNVKKTIENILDMLEKNFKYKWKNLNEYHVRELVTTLNDLFNVYAIQEPKECAEMVKSRFIPLLELLITIDKSDYEMLANYQDYLKNAYKISARHDFESFLIYYEWEKQDKFYAPRMEILGGLVYYLNKMIFDPEFEGIIANLPSGWGKTYIVDLANAFSYGIDPTGTILSLCSNEDVVNGGSRTIKEIMQSDEFGEVFPHLKWSKEDKEYYKKDTEGEWKLRDCKLASSYYARTTRSNVVGCRASKWVWIDDLYADYKEALNESDNKFYYNKFLTVWRKRFVQEAKIWKFIITGTMWSPTDFIVKIINWLEERYEFVFHPKFKYTRVSKDGKFAIVQVPALNVETNTSNCEVLAPTKTLLNEKRSLDSYIFECNFQQNPVSPEAMAFDWKNLKQYHEPLENEYGSTYAVIDGTRKSGKDFFSMPIFQPYMDCYALIDCIYTQQATSKLIPNIVEMIVKHNIKMLVIETNVDGGLKSVLLEKLQEIGFSNSIQIIEKYSTMVKQTRIELERGAITDKIFYPAQNLFAVNSDMGKFMISFTMYNIEGNNVHDDACFDGNTLIATKFGYKKIKDIKVGDKVLTPFGLRKVINCGITGYKTTINKFGLDVTPNHKVYNKITNKFTPIDRLAMFEECDKLSVGGLLRWKKRLLSLMGKLTKDTQRADIILSVQLEMKKENTASNSTEQYGNTTTERYQKGIMFTISMVTLTIMTLATWSCFLIGNICHTILRKCGKTLKIKQDLQKVCEEIPQLNKNAKIGIEVKKEEDGIENMPQTLFLNTNSEKPEHVGIVGQNLLQSNLSPNTVLAVANKKLTTTKKLKYVKFVTRSSTPHHTEQRLVQESVNQNYEIKPVYNITVENAGCYYANGILVSNCDSIAMFTSEIVAGKSKPQKPIIIKRPF